MRSKLITQMRNEWKANLWLTIELLLVSVVAWYISDFCYVIFRNALSDRGFDISHTYLIDVQELTDKSPDWKEYKSYDESDADRQEMLDRLARRPEIEAVGLGNNARPYTGSNGGIQVMYPKDDTTRIYNQYYTVRRMVTPGFVKVFRYTGTNGETPEQLAEMVERGEYLPSDNVLEHSGIRMSDLVGKEIYVNWDTINPVRVGASLNMIRYHDYEDWMNYSVVYKLPGLAWGNDWVVRVKDNMDHNFIENLMADANKALRVGNYFVAGAVSMEDIRSNFQRSSTNALRDFLIGMGFLMLNVFLGLFGTFWFRTQQRVREIAVRKATGATSRSILKRLLSEGILLLTIATVPAIIIDWVLAHYEFSKWASDGYFGWPRFLISVGISYLLLLIMIIAGVSMPAYRAMKVNPAEALHDE